MITCPVILAELATAEVKTAQLAAEAVVAAKTKGVLSESGVVVVVGA